MKVCIIQPVMKLYRVPFFTGLQDRLSKSGISLEVFYGSPWAEEAKRGDISDLPKPLGHKVDSHMLFGKLLLLPAFKPLLSADLIIVEHANKNILNYLIAALWLLGVRRVAYWGHGRDRQSNPNTLGERFKKKSLHWVDWWFAYTANSADYVISQGFDRKKITTVENSIDTRELREELLSVTDAERSAILESFKWSSDSKISVYCGSLYQNKRLDILFDAADIAHSQDPDFRLLIIGGGNLEPQVLSFVKDRSWSHYTGPKFGHEKAVLLSLAILWLNPGLVGLGILDAFSAGLPLLTTELPLHSPEIEYLNSGYNGIISHPTADAFAHEIIKILKDPDRLSTLRNGALESAKKYSIEKMIYNFSCGIEECLYR